MSNKIWQQPYTFSFFSPPVHVSLLSEMLRFLLQNKGNLLCCPHKLQFCHDNSQRDWHGNVHDNVNVFGLGGIDLLRFCGRASTETCYCQYVHNMLLWACKIYCCCIYNIHEITPYSIHVSPRSRSIQVELGKVKVFWSTLRTATTSTSHIFECWAESSLATDSGENKSAVPCDDVSRSDWVRPIRLRHLELHARTLYLSYFYK